MATTILKPELTKRMHAGDTLKSANAGSPFSWLRDVRMDLGRVDGTKEIYQRQLRDIGE